MLEQQGLDHRVQRNELPTGTVAVTLVEGIPQYEIMRPVAWDRIELTGEVSGVIERADAIVYGSIASREETGTRQAVEQMLSASTGAVKLFDVNLRAGFADRDVLSRLMDGATIVKINAEELDELTEIFGLQGDGELARLRALACRFELDSAILTAGAEASTVIAGDECSRIATPAVPVEDTVGAGDAFAGAFLASMLQGASLRQAHEKAVAVAAYVCTQPGAWPEYPTELSLKEMMS